LIGGSRHRLAEINCVKRISKKIRYLSRRRRRRRRRMRRECCGKS